VKSAGSPEPRRITWSFNLLVFALQSAYGVFRFVFVSGNASKMDATGILINVSLDLVRVVTLLLVSAYLLKEFWGRLVPSLAGLRPISFCEAVAIVLMIGILFGV
jgi:hypothetical protein